VREGHEFYNKTDKKRFMRIHVGSPPGNIYWNVRRQQRSASTCALHMRASAPPCKTRTRSTAQAYIRQVVGGGDFNAAAAEGSGGGVFSRVTAQPPLCHILHYAQCEKSEI